MKCAVLLQTHVIFPVLSRFNVLLENVETRGLYIRKVAVSTRLLLFCRFCELFRDNLS